MDNADEVVALCKCGAIHDYTDVLSFDMYFCDSCNTKWRSSDYMPSKRSDVNAWRSMIRSAKGFVNKCDYTENPLPKFRNRL